MTNEDRSNRRLWPDTVREPFVERACLIGFAMQTLWMSRLPYHQAWIIPAMVVPAITLRQIEFAFSPAGQPEALIAWACVTERVTQELTLDPARPLHISEWNEGSDLWIVAALGVPGRTSSLVRTMPRTTFSNFERIRGIQRRADGTVDRIRASPNPVWHRARHSPTSSLQADRD